jgi:catechol 2,3-dioxygenase-like lactoylglutathione lyase family enzyme
VTATNREAGRPLLSVMLIVPDASEDVGWYSKALGAVELWNLGGVAGLHLDGAPFFITRRYQAGRQSRALPTSA